MQQKIDLKGEVIEWNSKFPVDRWWRVKHKIPFMSPIHREANFIDMLFEFEEDNLFNGFEENTYTPNSGKWLDTSKQTPEQKISSLAEEARRELSKFTEEDV